jgi:hypothetical protein
MRKLNIMMCVLAIGILLFLIAGASAIGPSSQQNRTAFSKANALIVRTLSNINNWSYWKYYDGKSGLSPDDIAGGVYPRGTAGVVFQDGFVWGGIVDGQIRVGGATYNVGTTAGYINASGAQVKPDQDSRIRIYRIRTDYATLSAPQVLQDAAEINAVPAANVTEAMTDAVIEQYKTDWKEWPVDLGAPFVDGDGNGVYGPTLDADGFPEIGAGLDYPGIANADQVVWFVCNDLDQGATEYMYGSLPIGLELQVTVWGYNQPGARLGQIIFQKYLLINKAGPQVDSMYVAQWCDPDLGNSTDDVVGCDVPLSLGYAYNGEAHDTDFDVFGLAPPAMGYDFFQGPIVASPGDTAIFNLKYRVGYKNLPMTSFGYFSAGNVEWEDPTLQSYDGTLEWYNLLRGYITTNNVTNPTPFTHRATGEVTKFPLDGDPVLGTGDVDGEGSNFPPADRRMALCSGPFKLMPGDSQEVVVAMLGGHADSYLQSVSDLKLTDVVAQKLFDDLFTTVPKAPAAPKVEVTPEENQIVLNWGSDQAAVAATENPVISGYAFQGYDIYQFPTATSGLSQAVRIGTFDLNDGVTTIYGLRFVPQFGQELEVPVQYGLDKGVQRYFVVDKNYLTGEALFPGNTYYFAVTAYNYNPNPTLIQDKALESAATVIPVTTQSTKPGVRYGDTPGSEVAYHHTMGVSDGLMQVTVIDPAKLTGDSMEVYFTEDTDTASATYGETLWNVKDVTTGLNLVTNQVQQATLAASDAQPIFAGLQVKVSGPPVGINLLKPGPGGDDPNLAIGYGNGWNYTGTRWVSGYASAGGPTFFGGMFNGYDFFGSTLTATEYVDVNIEWAGATDRTDLSAEGLAAASQAEEPDRWSKAVVYRRDLGYAVQPDLGMIPFALYDTSVDPARRLKIAFVEDANAGSGNLLWDMGWDGSAFAAGGGREYIFMLNDTYDENYTDYLNETLDGLGGPVMYAIWPAARGTHPYLEADWDMEVYASKVNLAGEDVFSFRSPGNESSTSLAKQDVEKITVYPNPYYTFNEQEPDRFTQFVTFYHLPKKATIRIFDLSGVQVRKLEKNDNTQFFRWDLKNEANLPIASGLYIAYVDMPDLGKTKSLKVFIIQRKQILKYY